MGDEIETSLLVGLISDERDTSFIIKLSLTAWTGQVAYLQRNQNSQMDATNRLSNLRVHYKREVRKLEKIWVMCVCLLSVVNSKVFYSDSMGDVG